MDEKEDLDNLITPDAWLFGWKTVMAKKGFFVAFSLIMGALFFMQQYIGHMVEKSGAPFHDPHNLLSWVVSLIIGAIISLGGAYVSLKFCDGMEARLSDIFVSPRVVAVNFIAGLLLMILIGWPLFIVALVFALVMQFAGSFLIIGLFLFIPALFYTVVKFLKYQFYTYVIVDFDAGPLQALQLSRIIANKHEFELFGLDFKLMIMNLLGALCLGVGLLFTMPASFLALGRRYVFLRDMRCDELDVELGEKSSAAQLLSKLKA